MKKTIKDLTNKTFNSLTAVCPVEKPTHISGKNRGVWWLCKCVCGNEKIVRSTELIREDTKSCGCMKKYTNSDKYKGVGLIAQSVFSHIKWGAEKRNIEFNITKEYLWELYRSQEGKCYYTDLDISLNTRNNKKTASLDRIDSSKGYVEGNLVWVHKNINLMKNVFSKEEFLNYCNLIVNKHCPYDPVAIKGNKKIKKENKY